MNIGDHTKANALMWPIAKVRIVDDLGLTYLEIADRSDGAWVQLDKDIAGRIIDALHGYLQDQMMEGGK